MAVELGENVSVVELSSLLICDRDSEIARLEEFYGRYPPHAEQRP